MLRRTFLKLAGCLFFTKHFNGEDGYKSLSDDYTYDNGLKQNTESKEDRIEN
jgi:hypothetical protein